jgi:hypothetical protein
MIDQTRRAAETGISLQRAAVETWFDSAASTKSVQRGGLTLSRAAVDASLDGLRSMVPEEAVAELEAAAHEQFEAADELHEEAWTTTLQGLDEAEHNYEEMVEMQLELLADSFDAVEEMQSEAATTAEELTESA